ncbi:MAG: RagB/SusD family nutrient uptake outer membrane protein [Bacteroidota bacterium]|nr:RagB/SusD family nutrient uptake outer membrane protein [Bacteroidota bacterium]
MKRNIFKYITLSALIFNFYACEKNLDLVPLDQISEAVYFKEATDFKLFANSFYTYLPAFATTGSEANADLATYVGGSVISRGSYLPSEYDGSWNSNYDLIRNSTYLLTKFEGTSESVKNASVVYGAEAYFFRAFAYFNLLKSFGGVPLIPKVLELQDKELYSARASRIDIANQIISDLDKAIAILPNQSGLSAADNGRITKGAALALKSRVALFEGTWQKFHNGNDANDFLGKSIDAAKQIINSGEYELWDKRSQLGDQSYRHLFILDKKQTNLANFMKGDNKEYILVNRFDIDLRPISSYFADPTRKFADMFLCSDGLPIDKSPLFKGKINVVDEYENRDLRMRTLLMIVGNRYWSNWHAPWNRDWSRPNDPTTGFVYVADFGVRTVTGYSSIKLMPEIINPPGCDWPVIRFAEVLLNYAEADYEKNGAITDAELDFSINKVKARVGLPRLTNAFAGTNGLNIREEIRRERSIELYEEGFRYDDLRRWKIAEIEMIKPLLGIKYKGTQFETDPRWAGLDATFDSEGYLIVEDASKRQFDPKKHYLQPLPRRELLLNKNLVQNPGWE